MSSPSSGPSDSDASRYGPNHPASAGDVDATSPAANQDATRFGRTEVDQDGTRYGATPPPADPSGPDASGRSAPVRVRRVGAYELLRELGRGGMGIVYKAHSLKLDRLVALKMIRSGVNASDEDVKRFLSEAQAAARLDHPHIVPIFEIGEDNGTPYFAMPLVDGGSLQQRLAEGPVPAVVAARLLKQVAEAVQHAHDHGVIHRAPQAA